jgi:hypothetical protein
LGKGELKGDQAETDTEGNGFRAVGDAKLGVDGRDVEFGGVLADFEGKSNLLVRKALRKQFKNLRLALGELLDKVINLAEGEQGFAEERLDEGGRGDNQTLIESSHGGEQLLPRGVEGKQSPGAQKEGGESCGVLRVVGEQQGGWGRFGLGEQVVQSKRDLRVNRNHEDICVQRQGLFKVGRGSRLSDYLYIFTGG